MKNTRNIPTMQNTRNVPHMQYNITMQSTTNAPSTHAIQYNNAKHYECSKHTMQTARIHHTPHPTPPHSRPKRIQWSYSFSRKRNIFSMRGAESRKRGNFSGMSARKFWKKVKLCMYLFPVWDFIWSFRKMSWVWYSYSHFHKKGALPCITEKTRFALKKVVFYCAS